jgi:hypothetical protein
MSSRWARGHTFLARNFVHTSYRHHLGGALRDFLFYYENTRFVYFWLYMAFGGIWQHRKYSYGVWQSFAYNSENFEKWPKIEKCKQFSPATGFGPKPYKRFLFSSKSSAQLIISWKLRTWSRYLNDIKAKWPISSLEFNCLGLLTPCECLASACLVYIDGPIRIWKAMGWRCSLDRGIILGFRRNMHLYM